ncbi:MAG: preprotein translocase subunit SecE [Candidatus Dojkabacteria bacterium]|uniref:Protein translocase subunit SecE n=2 Tax=Candidatus Dojkabacteria TaxID=74243 RepID=A0A136KEM4_9BACT|nr:MAG: Protein translocase subunit SecE [candidate division WS6 bacterium OLB21]MBW7953269.1 preprotein translocase subunit SecE [Candidatus Dojkabacteria bacterium]WKZ28411.1 MAG: preprotein translocase subunit SecE [Candidatus Dojkabacteria bacterium]
MKKILGVPKSIANFLQEVIQEIKLVEFPSRSEVVRKTAIVFAVSITMGIILLGLDTLLVAIRNYLTSLTI